MMPCPADSQRLSSGSDASRSTRWRTLGICSLLALGVALVFGQSLDFDFINLDDNVGIYENPYVTHGLTLDGAKWAFTNRLNCNWDPLTWISHMADWQLYGPWAGGHHLTNVLLHAATVVLLFLALQRMSGTVWPSVLAAAIFAIHPLRAESVVWVTERKDVLSGLFFVLTLTAYASYAQRGSIWRYLVLMVIFAVGLLSKPVLVTVPFVLLLLDYWPLRRLAWGGADIPVGHEDLCNSGSQECLPHVPPHPQYGLWRLIVEKMPLAALAAVCCYLIVWAEKVSDYPVRGAYWRIGNALISYVVYLRQFFWPTDLALLYPRRGPDLPMWQVVGAGAIVLAITAAVFLWRRKHPYLIVGWLWYLVMMSPMIGLVAFGNEAPADRFTYLPQIGIAIGLAWWGADWCCRRPYRRCICGVASMSAILAFMACGAEQASYWRNSATLWRHTLACTTDNYWVCNQLGDALGTAGRYDDAQRAFRDAARIIEKRMNVCKTRSAGKLKSLEEKGLTQDYSTAYYRLGVTAASRDQMDRAVVYYQKAIDIDNNNSLAHNNLGYALLVSGEYYEAIRHFEEAARISPEFAAAHLNQGQALSALGHHRAAIAEYRKAIGLKPDYAEAYCCLGLTLATNGQQDQAIAQLRKALAVKPDFKEARTYLESLQKQRPAKSPGRAPAHRP